MSTLSLAQAQSYLQQYTDLSGQLSPLKGDEDHNFLLQCSDKQKYLLKISQPHAQLKEIELQTALMLHLEQSDLPISTPQSYLLPGGKSHLSLPSPEGPRILRVQSWISGNPLGDFQPKTVPLLQSWGKAAGLLSKHLQNFDHPQAHREYPWDPVHTLHNRDTLELFPEKEQKEIAKFFWDRFESETLPQLSDLRHSVNHNDLHEWNLILSGPPQAPLISGVIDFGDAVFTPTINEIAIAGAYAAMKMPDPLGAVAELLKAYHSIFPVQEQELPHLFSLIAARLLTSVSFAARRAQHSDNPYHFLSQKPAWDLLRKWRKISPTLAHFTFRAACDFEACPAHIQWRQWQEDHPKALHFPIAGKDLPRAQLDLSVDSLDLGNNSVFENRERYEKRLADILQEQKAQIGVGGYGEIRPFYSSDEYQTEGNQGPRWRTTHLGIDFWAPAQTPVYACWDGVVQSLQNNRGKDNYGPTVILRHAPSPELIFYSLYGHLSEESLAKHKVGDHLAAGDWVGSLGVPEVNGGWPPHLHFQLMLDLLDLEGDFPGVGYPDQQKLWQSICPDPGPFWGIAPSQQAPEDAKLLQTRKKHLGRSLSLLYDPPLHISRGYRQYLYDRHAQRYLDTANNVAHVGHEHPRIVRAGQRQMALLNTNTRYLHPTILEYAEALLAKFPPQLSVCHFVNSGSEANELALRMAKTASRAQDIIALETGYHGNTQSVLDVSSYKFDGKGGQGCPPNTHLLPVPDSYRGLYRDPATAGKQYATHLPPILDQLRKEGKKPAALLVEGMMSCAGQIEHPSGYLQELFQQIRAAGGYCIVDEVQTGFGRMGSHFWAFERSGVIPDIVTLGKPIGNGHPLGAVICTPEVAEAFANGMEYFNTFGGNPVSAAIGLEVLRTVQEENLQENALKMGEMLIQGFQELAKEHPIIGDIRGSGLFIGIELVKNPETREPAGDACQHLANRLAQQNILIGTDGPDHNVIKIKPPLCFDAKNVQQLLERTQKVLRESYFQL